ncbi:MAG TPA: hypothetical protein VGF63_13635 [Solirubrobacteraceae bacterium]|jgi:hypothetical protein
MRTGGALRRARDRAAKLARMTREDSEQLAAVFLQVATFQARDALGALRRRLARGPAADGGRRPPR